MGRRLEFAALVALIVLLTCALVPVSAQADTSSDGAISGVVTSSASGQPIAGIQVTGTGYSSTDGEITVQACTAADGSYSLAGLESGTTYEVSFWPNATCGALDYLPQVYGAGTVPLNGEPASTENPTQIPVSAGTTTSGIDAALQPGGAITGTVTDTRNTPDIGDVSVEATGPEGSAYGCIAGGQYVFPGLPPGNYTVGFATYGNCTTNQPTYDPLYYGGSSVASSAGAVTVSAGSTTTGISATLTPSADNAVITGTVTDARTGQPAAPVPVLAYFQPPEGTADGDGDSYGWLAGNYGTSRTCSTSTGSYSLGDLPAGNYTVAFNTILVQGCGIGNYIPQEYDNAPAPLTTVGFDDSPFPYPGASLVTATDNTVTSGIDAELAPAATISGTLTNAITGAPAAQIEVQFLNSQGTQVGAACSNSTGQYTSPELPSGTYYVAFDSDDGSYVVCLTSTAPFVPQYYAGKSTLASATPVALSAPTDATQINAALDPGASITGTITELGRPEGGTISVLDASDQAVKQLWFSSPGVFTISGLTPGNYRLEIDADHYQSEYYPGTPVQSAATDVTVGEKTISTANFLLTPADQTAAITGTVSAAADRQPLAGITVDAVSRAGLLDATAITAGDGSYALDGLAAGQYQVIFIDPESHYASQFATDSSTPAGAQTLTLASSQTASAVDAALVPATVDAPPAALVSHGDIRVSAAGVADLDLACPGAGSCAGRVQVAASRRSTAPFAVRTGRIRHLTVRLDHATLVRLSAHHRVRATVLLVEAGHRAVRYPVTLSRPPVRRRGR